jgi:hypothetical protein
MTLSRIESWQRTSLALAQRARAEVPDAALKAILTQNKMPPELWDQVRGIIGRHRPYRDAPGLTEQQRHRLAALTDLLESKPPERWTKTDRQRELERARLRARLHGKAVIKQIEDPINGVKGGTSAPHLSVLTARVIPGYLRGLWRAFDVWGAREHGLSVKRFRYYRLTLQRSDDPLYQTLRRHQPRQKPERHRTR